jgi:hypothetical protein
MLLSNQILSLACFMSCSSLCWLVALLHFLLLPSPLPICHQQLFREECYMKRECLSNVQR